MRWRIQFECRVRALVLKVQNGLLPDVYLEALLSGLRRSFRLILGQRDEVAHLALERHVGHKAVAGLRVQTRQIASIRVTIGVAVLYVEQQDEVIAIVQGHFSFLLGWFH